jgi:putative addiction module component (TIGR02574 family)
MPDLKDLLLQAMELPPEARAALAGSLLESLDSATDADAEAAWSIEIDRRVRELEQGAVKNMRWMEARKRISG